MLRQLSYALAAAYLIVSPISVANAQDLDSCPGYKAGNVTTSGDGSTLTATLTLAGTACNVYGNDTTTLNLEVQYQTDTRLHVKISDPAIARYEIPDSVLPRPNNTDSSADKSQIVFNYTESPFSFSIIRKSNGEALFSTGSHPLIIEPQYLRVKTDLPENANIYGLGEHTNPFRLDPSNTTITLWNREAPGVASATNLYGDHPIYFEQRPSGAHGVFFMNSNGMDIKLTPGALEYNVVGGLLDYYFLAGSETDPVEVARQYSELIGRSAEMPYWSFGLHQCRFGYHDFVDVAQVVTNYSEAQIPLETMWTDIDYMDRRRIFTLDPDYFPLDRMREIVSYLHEHDQHYIVMNDPGVYKSNDTEDYPPYEVGHQDDVFLHAADGTEALAIVWPGVVVYPDWFNPKTQDYWNGQFSSFYSAENGLDVDGMWIDMNEPSNFCDLPCTDPFVQAAGQGLPPPRVGDAPAHDTPIFQNESTSLSRRQDPDQDIWNPLYRINNGAYTGNLSSKTAYVDWAHANGLVNYNTHNLYGTMMSTATREALINRRPGQKPLVITRSTFAGAGKHVGKWLGDNLSTWWHYKNSIAGILGFASVYSVPMVGADVCGFGEDTTENLCARWAMLGAFYPFMRNHNGDTSIPQEFYRWEVVAQAARNAIDMRYRLTDYIYTAFHQAAQDGTPVLHPLFFQFPKDGNTYGIDTQFFYGDSILISPVIDEGSTSVDIYLPNEHFYDFLTGKAVQGQGANLALSDVNYTSIPVHIKGGAVIPLRVNSSMTLTELRKNDFEFVVAPGANNGGSASGQLYLDDGESLAPESSSLLKLDYTTGSLKVTGEFGYSTGVKAARARFLGVGSEPSTVSVNGADTEHSYDAENGVLTVAVDQELEQELTVEFS